MAVTWLAAQPFSVAIAGVAHSYAAGDVVDITGWTGPYLNAMLDDGKIFPASSSTQLASQLDSRYLGLSMTKATMLARSGDPTGFLVWASDDNGGKLYRYTGSAWAAVAPGINEAAGQLVGPSVLGTSFTLTQTGATTAVAATFVPSTARDVGVAITATGVSGKVIEVNGKVCISQAKGTGTAGNISNVYACLVDAATVGAGAGSTTPLLRNSLGQPEVLLARLILPTQTTAMLSLHRVQFFDDTLAAGSSRTYKLYTWKDTNSSADVNAAVSVQGTDLNQTTQLAARFG